jgi:hypothetical protein
MPSIHPPTYLLCHSLDRLDSSQVTVLYPLQRQRRNERCTNTAAVLGGRKHNGILPRRPVENLAQGLSASGLEVRVFVEDGAVGANVAGGDVLLLADGCYAAGRESSGPGPD